jgi:hypothetical protein
MFWKMRSDMTTKRWQANSVESGRRRRPPRPRKIEIADDFEVPGYLKGKGKSVRLPLTAEDYVWIGDDGRLDPVEVLRQKGFEQKGAFRLLLEAIVDGNPGEQDGPTRAQRIDGVEALLLGTAQRPGVDQFDDDEVLRLVAKLYFEQWVEYPDREIEAAPIAKFVLSEFDLQRSTKSQPANQHPRRPLEHDINSAVRRIVRKFKNDRDRLLASVTHDPRWDPPKIYLDLLSIIDTLNGFGIKANSDVLRSRLDRKEWSQNLAIESVAEARE